MTETESKPAALAALLGRAVFERCARDGVTLTNMQDELHAQLVTLVCEGMIDGAYLDRAKSQRFEDKVREWMKGEFRPSVETLVAEINPPAAPPLNIVVDVVEINPDCTFSVGVAPWRGNLPAEASSPPQRLPKMEEIPILAQRAKDAFYGFEDKFVGTGEAAAWTTFVLHATKPGRPIEVNARLARDAVHRKIKAPNATPWDQLVKASQSAWIAAAKAAQP
jgi:hypothetical protein